MTWNLRAENPSRNFCFLLIPYFFLLLLFIFACLKTYILRSEKVATPLPTSQLVSRQTSKRSRNRLTTPLSVPKVKQTVTNTKLKSILKYFFLFFGGFCTKTRSSLNCRAAQKVGRITKNVEASNYNLETL